MNHIGLRSSDRQQRERIFSGSRLSAATAWQGAAPYAVHGTLLQSLLQSAR